MNPKSRLIVPSLLQNHLLFGTCTCYDIEGTIVSYLFDFGDWTQGTVVTPEHAYREAGNYKVTWTIINHGGASASATDKKTIQLGDDAEIHSASSLSVLSLISLAVTVPTVTILYWLFIRRNKKKQESLNQDIA